jgi:hypothetical protein
VILLLAIGLPLLLLGGFGAVFFVLTTDQSSVAAREALQTQADEDPPDVQLDPGTAPPPSAAPGQTTAPEQTTVQQQQAAKIGDAITLEGNDLGLKVAVTVSQVFSPATPANTFTKPQIGKRFVAIEVTLTNQGQAVYSDSPTNGAVLIDAEGQQYRAAIITDVREGQSFGGSATVNTGDSRKGVIVFEVPEAAKPAKFQFALDSGLAEQKGEWQLG